MGDLTPFLQEYDDEMVTALEPAKPEKSTEPPADYKEAMAFFAKLGVSLDEYYDRVRLVRDYDPEWFRGKHTRFYLADWRNTGDATLIKKCEQEVSRLDEVASDPYVLTESHGWVKADMFVYDEPLPEWTESEEKSQAHRAKRFPKNVLTSFQKRQQKAKSSIADYERRIANYQTQIIGYERSLRSAKQTLTAGSPETLEALYAHLALLKKHAFVEEVGFTNKGLGIKTTMIRGKSPNSNRQVNVGQFLITFYLGSDNATWYVEAENLTYRYGSYDHPNVSDGGICFGGNDDEVGSMLTAMDFMTLLDFLVEFLGTLVHEDEDDDRNPHIDPSDWMLERRRRYGKEIAWIQKL